MPAGPVPVALGGRRRWRWCRIEREGRRPRPRLGQLFDLYAGGIHRDVASPTGTQVVEDLGELSETFLAELRNRDIFDPIRSNTAGVVVGTATKLLRSHQRSEVLPATVTTRYLCRADGGTPAHSCIRSTLSGFPALNGRTVNEPGRPAGSPRRLRRIFMADARCRQLNAEEPTPRDHGRSNQTGRHPDGRRARPEHRKSTGLNAADRTSAHRRPDRCPAHRKATDVLISAVGQPPLPGGPRLPRGDRGPLCRQTTGVGAPGAAGSKQSFPDANSSSRPGFTRAHRCATEAHVTS